MFHDIGNAKQGARDNVGDDRSWATPVASSYVECDLLKNLLSGTESSEDKVQTDCQHLVG